VVALLLQLEQHPEPVINSLLQVGDTLLVDRIPLLLHGNRAAFVCPRPVSLDHLNIIVRFPHAPLQVGQRPDNPHYLIAVFFRCVLHLSNF